jgi:lysozyme
MTLNKEGLDIIKKYEGLSLSAYKCPAGKVTIGFGNTFYEDGKPVQMGDKITKERADYLLSKVANSFGERMKKYIKQPLNENQFSALLSWTYNCGIGNLMGSTLLKKINANPNDATIRQEFMKWNRASGKVLLGLTRRREAEANLYFKTP